MGTLYVGTRAIYTDDKTGFYWDSPLMRERLNQDGTPYVQPETEIPVVTTVVTAPVETETVIEEPVKESLVCPQCGFEARSRAGLAVHKMKHVGHES